jgi:hypothetical protein
VRQPPDYATHIDELDIANMINPVTYPVAEGQELVSLLGLRTGESQGRMMGLHSQKGFLTGENRLTKVRSAWPIYDWTDADVWLAFKRYGWDYSTAYDAMHRAGCPKHNLRLGPPTMNGASAENLRLYGARIWPEWFDRVCSRLPSVRTFAKFGVACIRPQRRLGESWEECFHRTCVKTAPDWVADRALVMRDRILSAHRHHSHDPLPQVGKCSGCTIIGSWSDLAHSMYTGDPFSSQCSLPCVQPEFFRPGAGWYGKGVGGKEIKPVKPKQPA